MEEQLFDEALRQRLIQNLAQFNIHSHQKTDGLKEAAVSLTIVNMQHPTTIYGMAYDQDWYNHGAIILTQRAAKMNRHAGKWDLPGGRVDRGETAVQAALRELQEEVGLNLDETDLIGKLDDFTTRSGYIMHPFIFWGGSNVQLHANPDEVSAIHRIPIAEFLRADSPILEPMAGSEYPVLLMPIGNSWIAAPTAAIIYQFREVAIHGKHTRVAHYEQPRFAWK